MYWNFLTSEKRLLCSTTLSLKETLKFTGIWTSQLQFKFKGSSLISTSTDVKVDNKIACSGNLGLMERSCIILGRYIKYWDIDMQSGAIELLRGKKGGKKKKALQKNPCRFSRVLCSGIQQSSNCMITLRSDMVGTCSKMRGFWLSHLIEAALR